MPSIYFHPNNCGLRDLVILQASPKQTILEVCRASVSPKYVGGGRVNGFAPIAAHIIFSQASSKTANSYGDKLAKFIEDNDFGVVIRSEPVLNPDHGPAYITVYVWTPNVVTMEKWWEENKPAEKTAAPSIGNVTYNYSGKSNPMYCPGLPPATKENTS